MSAFYPLNIQSAILNALLDAQTTPVLLSYATGRIVWANVATQSLLNVSLRTLVGSSLTDWLQQEQASPSHDLLPVLAHMANQPNQPIQLEVQLKNNQGIAQPCLQAVLTPLEKPIKPITKNTGAHTVAIADIDFNVPLFAIELISHAPALLLQAAQYRRVQQQTQRVLLRNLAHEIRNPLGGIRGAAQLLARELSPNQQEYIAIIVAETTRLQSLLDRLLSAQAAPRTLSWVNIHELFERVRCVVAAEYPDAITWRRDYDVSLPEIAIDEHQIVQVLMNLVRNAAQILMDSEQLNKHITLSSRSLRHPIVAGVHHKLAVELAVIDNGWAGITPDILPYLFNPLVSQRVGGTGLGLHIAQSFVQQHHGTIDVETKPRQTAFKVILPIIGIEGTKNTEGTSTEGTSTEGINIEGTKDTEKN